MPTKQLCFVSPQNVILASVLYLDSAPKREWQLVIGSNNFYREVKFMKWNIFKSKINSATLIELQAILTSKKSVSFNPLVTTINYVKETYEEETDEEIVAVPVVLVVQAKPIKWYTKVHDFFYTLTQTNHNDDYSSVNDGYSANHDEVNSYPNTVNLDVSDTVNLTGAESTMI
ncbi:hypothetical protein [Candidatus Tisiphia endosymbiont of Sialis lutaria]|uniref:hypothetical protein n=1 Tax=Candidatus Tisiphia endosymbiont of Sialis lutaria TaxID=2029164 RepID=UPI00312C9A4F